MNRIIAFSSRHAVAIIPIVLALTVLGAFALRSLPRNALPDTGDRQILVVAKSDRSPESMLQQVARPIAVKLKASPGITSLRGVTEYGITRLYATVSDDISIVEVRADVQQAIENVRAELPENTVVQLGPDANATGWIYQYVLLDRNRRLSLSQLRDLQDWTIRPELSKTPGIAEIASVGGFQTQYQVTVDPLRLRELNISFDDVVGAIRSANSTTTARMLDFGGQNFILRAPSLLHSMRDLAGIVVPSPEVSMEARMEKVTSRPILLDKAAFIQAGPEMRESVAAYDGSGEAVGGIVIMRQGENAAAVLADLKARIEILSRSLPPGLFIHPTYDRSKLITRAISNFKGELFLAVVIVSVLIFLFLNDPGSAIVAVITIPVCICMSGIALRLLHVELNILTLAGLALSVGILVDGSIIQLENVIYRLGFQDLDRGGQKTAVLAAFQEVSPGVFLALSIIVVAFLPLLAFAGPEGKLFRPLVIAKTAVMVMAALSALIITPALRTVFLPLTIVGTARADRVMPFLISTYELILRSLLSRPWTVVLSAVILIEFTIPVFLTLGSEFLPPFEEESRLFMPTTTAGLSIAAARDLIERQNRILLTIPEVSQVFAKAGHADTATDPAPLSMIETNVEFRPQSEWRTRRRWYTAGAPEWLKKAILRPLWPDHIAQDQIVSELDEATHMPGVVNAWTAPIRGRTDMLASGARTPFVVKVLGPDLRQLDQIALRVSEAFKAVAGTKLVYVEPSQNGNFLDIQLDNARLAETGLQLESVQKQFMPALGGVAATTVYEGPIPRTVYVRYPRDFRDTTQAIESLEIKGVNGETLRLGELAKISPSSGPSMIRSEFEIPSTYVYVDASVLDTWAYLKQARASVDRDVHLPPQYSLEWGGRFQDVSRLRDRLAWILPMTLLLIATILGMATRSWAHTLLICLAVPFSLTGCAWFLSILHYKLSAAVWVGIMALLGLDAETGIFMLLFLELEYRRNLIQGQGPNRPDLSRIVIDGAARRLRPKLMTVAAASLGLLPILLSNDSGADFTKRMVVPICGGLFSSFLLELLVYPPMFFLLKRRSNPIEPGQPL